MNKLLVEIASWQIVSELQRRYSGQFKVIETHPGSGIYDCLSLLDPRLGRIADLNREGRFHVFRRYDGLSNPEPMEIWEEMLNSTNPKLIIDEVSRRIGLPVPKILPLSSPTVLTYRFIASFLKHSVFGMHKWECRNGFFDTSGYGGGVVNDFEIFPGAKERLQVIMSDDVLNEPAYRFWFIRKDGIPKICLETNGFIWVNSGESHDLMELYVQNRRQIWPTIGKIAMDIFS